LTLIQVKPGLAWLESAWLVRSPDQILLRVIGNLFVVHQYLPFYRVMETARLILDIAVPFVPVKVWKWTRIY
jgi:hypothetical protein